MSTQQHLLAIGSVTRCCIESLKTLVCDDAQKWLSRSCFSLQWKDKRVWCQGLSELFVRTKLKCCSLFELFWFDPGEGFLHPLEVTSVYLSE